MANRMPDENRHLAPAIGILLLLLAARATGDSTTRVERWGLWDMTLDGPANGNPCVEARLSATFERGDRQIIVPGFWDGDKYRIRFSPPEEGEWRYVTGSNRPELDGRSGKLTVVAPAGANHGPVQIFKSSCLRYADGSPYHQFGTTCYAWTHQPDALQEQTLRTLADAPFNKIRFCVFPKSYAYNTNEPSLFPFARRPDRTFDCDRPDPAYWRQFEGRILDLQKLGIEADLVLWHPYDRWGFSEMTKEQDDRYLRYCIARLSAFRNVWWSLANEYDLMAPGAMKGHRGNKTMQDWDRFFQILASEDPHQRLRSIHNCRGFYDHTKPWVTHASLQTSDMNAGIRFRAQFGKPVIYDECKYEGDVPQGWGNLTPREMTQRFWLGTLGGCYVGHGETYRHPEDILWWSKGGALHGKSAGRIQWLKDFMAKAPPFHDLQPAGDDKGRFLLAKPGEYYLLYALSKQPQALDLAGDRPYKIDRIDPWEMTISPLGTARPGARDFAPPQADMVYRFVPYAAGEPLRPEAAIDAAPAAGRAPLPVRFSAPAGLGARWDFGDGSVSNERAPAHVFCDNADRLPPLRVTANRRFFETADGKPFFWLADTAWQLLHDLDETEMRLYFADRRDKGFTVVQTVALAELRGDTPNAFGHLPIEPKRPDRPLVKDGPDNDYWDDVERAVRLAGEHGLYVGLLPTWGKHVTSNWQNGLVDGFFTAENAEAYGRFIGARLRDLSHIVWILGGDRAAPTDASRAIWRAMARGIATGSSGKEDYDSVLMTYHTSGPGSTAWFLNSEPWMDFHGLQSGHGRWALNWQMVEHAYGMKPTLPVIDLESSYPGFRHGRPPTVATDDDARRAACWALFAGAAGHTYGHHSIWQMHAPKYPGVAGPQKYWREALDAPSAAQMGHLRRLFESLPFVTLKPDLSLLAFEQSAPWEMCLALCGDNVALAYTPTGRTLEILLDPLAAPDAQAAWFDPRTGALAPLGSFKGRGRHTFDPPGEQTPGNDWILLLRKGTPLSPRQKRHHRGTRTRDHVRRDQLPEFSHPLAPRCDRGFDGRDVALDDDRDIAPAELLFAKDVHVGGLAGDVNRLKHRRESLRLD